MNITNCILKTINEGLIVYNVDDGFIQRNGAHYIYRSQYGKEKVGSFDEYVKLFLEESEIKVS